MPKDRKRVCSLFVQVLLQYDPSLSVFVLPIIKLVRSGHAPRSSVLSAVKSYVGRQDFLNLVRKAQQSVEQRMLKERETKCTVHELCNACCSFRAQIKCEECLKTRFCIGCHDYGSCSFCVSTADSSDGNAPA